MISILPFVSNYCNKLILSFITLQHIKRTVLLRGQSTRPSNVVGLIRQSLAGFTFEYSACQTEIDHRCTEEIAIGILRNIVRVHKRIEYIQKFRV